MKPKQREELAQSLLADVAADEALEPGSLPWRMRAEQWQVFKLDPERFRKPGSPLLAELPCSECGNRYLREDLIFESEQVHYCKSCLEIL